MALRPQQPPVYKIYIGGVWTGYGHDDVRQWLWNTTHTTPLSIRCWQKGADATMQSCFVGYGSYEVAQTALAILQHNPYMWGTRVTVTWGRDNPGVPQPSQPAVPPGPSQPAAPSGLSQHAGGEAGPAVKNVGVQVGPSFLDFFDQEVDAGQEDELQSPGGSLAPSEATLLVPPTEPARSPTVDPPTSSPSSEVGTADGSLKKETMEAVERVKRVKVKEEVKEE